MMELRLSSFSKARFWGPGEVSALEGEGGFGHRTKADSSILVPKKELAVEVSIPRGAVVSYGLLGGILVPVRGADSLNMSIVLGQKGVFPGSLARSPERAICGLSEEYVDGIIDGFVAVTDELSPLPGGALTFDRGAFGQIGSSPILFHGLAACVTRLLLGDLTPWDTVLREELRLA